MRQTLFVAAIVLFAAPLYAQSSPYVNASIELSVFRTDQTTTGSFQYPNGSGEVPAGSVRVGSALGEQWGVELEYVYAGRLATDAPVFRPLLRPGNFQLESSGIPGVLPGVLPIPFDYQSRISERHTSLNAALWVRQPLRARVDLVYLGGAAFTRRSQDFSVSITPLLRTLALPRVQRTSTIDYQTGLMLGLEARVRLTEHVKVIPALRLQSVDKGWWLRTAAGLGWDF